MKATTLFLLALLLAPATAPAQPLTAEKKAAIHKLMMITGAGAMKARLGELYAAQVTALYRSTNPQLPPRAAAIVAEEARAVIDARLSGDGGLFEVIYPIYAEHFTLEEINALVAFYRTPAGSKALRVMPQVTQEAMRVGQQWSQAAAHAIQARVARRFAAEGIR